MTAAYTTREIDAAQAVYTAYALVSDGHGRTHPRWADMVDSARLRWIHTTRAIPFPSYERAGGSWGMWMYQSVGWPVDTTDKTLFQLPWDRVPLDEQRAWTAAGRCLVAIRRPADNECDPPRTHSCGSLTGTAKYCFTAITKLLIYSAAVTYLVIGAAALGAVLGASVRWMYGL